MSYLLDTSVAISMRDGDLRILDKIGELNATIAISVVTQVELEGGVARDSTDQKLRRARLDEMLPRIPVMAFEKDAAQEYGRIVAACGYSRRKLIDRMIAAQALVMNATLVTLNASDFSDVPNLKILAL